MLDMTASRRNVLMGSAGLLVSFAFGRSAIGAPTPDGAKAGPWKPVPIDNVDSFLAIGHDGVVTVYSGKVDLGTGVRTALTQIVAEELDLPMQSVSLITGDTAVTPDQGITSGSLSIEKGGMQIRQAAATARKALLELAAQQLGEPSTSLSTEGGEVRSGQKSLSYAALLHGQSFNVAIDPAAPTKDPSQFKIVGSSSPRLDIPDKCTGRFTYIQDFRIEGMLHGRVVRPPAMGATLKSVDASPAEKIPGFIKVIRQDNFLGVVARTEWSAVQASRALKAEWSEWAELPDQAKLFESVRATKVAKDEVTSAVGDVSLAMQGATKTLQATYDFAIHTHGSIGPSCAVAQIVDGRLTCWTAAQSAHTLRVQLAKMLDMPSENVRCVYVDGAGCYGRNGHEDAAADAALLSRAMDGQPVRVQWMRADEHVWDPKGPPTLLDMEGGVDEKGEVVAWTGTLFTPAVMGTEPPLLPAELARTPATGAMNPGNVFQDLAVPYGFRNVRTLAHRLETTPFRPSWIRSPGRMQNTFANEAFLDELAAAAGADPMAFRLSHLRDPRGIDLLQRLAKISNWQARPSPLHQTGDVLKGRGLSYVRYDLTRAYVGAVAEVEVTRKTGAIKVARIFVVQDCGQIVNPDGVRNQIEGNMIQTVSRTLFEEVTFNRSTVTSQDWSSYPIITFPDIPQVVVDLIDRPAEKPLGSGEPSAAIVPGAISNAIFDATGARLRSVPMTPSKVLAAMT